MRRDQIIKAIEQNGSVYIRDVFASECIFDIHQSDDGCYVLNAYAVINEDPIIIDDPTDLGCYESIDELIDENHNIRNGRMVPFNSVSLH